MNRREESQDETIKRSRSRGHPKLTEKLEELVKKNEEWTRRNEGKAVHSRDEFFSKEEGAITIEFC